MFPPLTHVLIKTVARGFYREHSGFLLFLFVTFMIYGFFINVLNEGHVPPEKLTFYHLLLTVTFVSSPIMMILVFVVWSIYTIKSWKFVTEQLSTTSHQFLFYSSTSFSKFNQFKSWFFVQLYMSMPLVVYALFATAAGIVFQHYVIPVIILLYLAILITVSSFFYTRCVNRHRDVSDSSVFIKLTHRWRKSFFNLFLFYISDKQKLTYFITKLLSLTIVLGFYNFFQDDTYDFRVSGITALCLVLAHTLLIYKSHEFEVVYLNFTKNFPRSRTRLFINIAALYLLLMLPESTWLLIQFSPMFLVIELLLFCLSAMLLFRSLLYLIGSTMRTYLSWVFGLFIVFFLAILFELLWLLILLVLPLSFTLFYRNYYTSR